MFWLTSMAVIICLAWLTWLTTLPVQRRLHWGARSLVWLFWIVVGSLAYYRAHVGYATPAGEALTAQWALILGGLAGLVWLQISVERAACRWSS